jgi:CheY-like chemotaxis protein
MECGVQLLREADMMANSKRPVIMVVEDDPLALTLATDMIAVLGFEAIPASNADVAMAILEHGESVHVVFTDVKMPGAWMGSSLLVLSMAVGQTFDFL